MSSHSILGGEFAFELGDVPLALAQHVGDARHVQKRRVADLRAVGADGDEKVALVGHGLGGIHARLHGVARLVRLERDALDVVLQEHRNVRKELPSARA